MRFSELPKKVVLSYIGLVVSYVIWSAATPIIKLTLDFIPPYTFLFLRFLIVGIILLPYVIYLLQVNRVARQDYLNIALLGVFSQSSLIILFVALQYTTSLDATIIGILGPLLSMVAGHYFYKDRINAKVKLGTVITLIGALIVTIEPLLISGDSVETVDSVKRFYGNILILIYNLSFLLYVIWAKISLGQTPRILKKTLHFIHLKPMSKEYPAGVTTALSFYVGLLTMIPAAIVENLTTSPVDVMSMGVKPIIGLLYMAVFSSIIAYFAFERSLDNVTVSDTALMGYTQPLLTLPFAYLLLKELPTPGMVFGCGVIFTGILIAEIGAHARAKLAEAASLSDA
ncbi:DMT family transporter [candidate division WWE3 bacterium]|uniref:DMT family transporter n=1 Tax=candidate division WWE3 bacterium TaxID=2053526 RepID=A0A7X9HGM7_UNCKA|nr:DMT family transporter [candidate division WWE3 bacterium]